MRKLKCTSCGGTLGLVTAETGDLIGRCANCGSQYVVETKGRQHVILEHRFPDGRLSPPPPVKSPQPLSRRALMAGLGVAAVAGLALVLRAPSRPDGAAAGPAVNTLFNVGGEGAGPGLFRETPTRVGVDSLGRAVVQDHQERYYVFGPDGAFRNQFVPPQPSNSMLAVLPDGHVVADGDNQLHRIDPATGVIVDSQPQPKGESHWLGGEAHCVTPEGGLAQYLTAPRRESDDPSLPPPDRLVILDRNLREIRRIEGLLSQALAADPMVSDAPLATSVAMGGAGQIYLAVKREEDLDDRDGIYEFNADGRFQRRIPTSYKFRPRLAVGGDGRVWVSDPWDNRIEEVTPEGIRPVDLAALMDGAQGQLGNISDMAAYADGDLLLAGLSTGRLVRISVEGA